GIGGNGSDDGPFGGGGRFDHRVNFCFALHVGDVVETFDLLDGLRGELGGGRGAGFGADDQVCARVVGREGLVRGGLHHLPVEDGGGNEPGAEHDGEPGGNQAHPDGAHLVQRGEQHQATSMVRSSSRPASTDSGVGSV